MNDFEQDFEQEDLHDSIEDLELGDMDEKELDAAWRQFSPASMLARADRKKTRYKLYKLKANREGVAAGYSEEFLSNFENQKGFNGWENFSVEWDVAFNEPTKVVSRAMSAEDEWNEIVRSKFPQIQPGGGVAYPNKKVERAVKKEAVRQKAMKAEKELKAQHNNKKGEI